MQKTFKKALACLLAVLMLICAVPFSAYAAGPTQWWVTDGVDPATVVAEPEYEGYNTMAEPWELTFGTYMNKDDGYEDLRQLWKPVIGITVSDIGNNSMTKTELKEAYDDAYAFSTANTYDAVLAAGKILNPTDLKAGQRIAVTLEFGGFDAIMTGQFRFLVDTNFITPAGYNGQGSAKRDSWTVGDDYSWVKTVGDMGYGSVLTSGGSSTTTATGECYLNINSGKVGNKLSTFLGTGLNDATGARSFGKYGIVGGVVEFEVKQNCNLKDVLTFPERNLDAGEAGTFFVPFDPSKVEGGGAAYIAFGNQSDVFANPLVIWSGANGAATREFDVTVAPFSNGTVTMDGETVDPATGATKKIAENNVVTLTATPAANAQFVGWKANDGTTVSTEHSITAVVNANITYTPYFVVNDASTFVVKFVDAFENIVRVQTVTNGSEVIIPPVPARAGYIDGKWSLTEAQIADLTEDTVITPIYTKITEKEYTVTVPAGSTITVNGENRGTTTQVPYNTQVTVYNPKAASWKINGATVAYGDTYTFYVGADVELTIDETPVTVQTPVVGSVNIDVSADGKRVSFLATRKIDTAEGWVQVNAGFMYGTTGVTASTELVDVNGTSVKAVYTKTDSEQFSISFNVTAGKTYNGRAFITYKNAADEINVAYANLQTYKAV